MNRNNVRTDGLIGIGRSLFAPKNATAPIHRQVLFLILQSTLSSKDGFTSKALPSKVSSVGTRLVTQ